MASRLQHHFEHAVGARRLVEQHAKRRDVGIPLDQGRAGAEALHDLGEQRPHAVADPGTVIVDQDRFAVGIVHGVAREVILGDRLARQAGEPVMRIEPEMCAVTTMLLASSSRPQPLRRASSARNAGSDRLESVKPK